MMEPQVHSPAPKPAPAGSGFLGLLIEYGPILVFFLVYRHYAPARSSADGVGEVFAVVRGTIGFMVAAVLALAASWLMYKRVSPMLMLSTALVVVFGSMTIFLHETIWIQIKPTVIYLVFGISLLVAWLRGKALLKYLLQAAFEGLDEAGWLILSRNWGWCFLFFAALNEVLRRQLAFDQWIAAKLWLFMPMSFLFTMVHLPMLLRHGLGAQGAEDAIGHPPTE